MADNAMPTVVCLREYAAKEVSMTNEKNLTAKRATETDSEKPEVPEDFICVDPQQKPMVLQFLASSNQKPLGQILVHLELCLHCREIAANMRKTESSSNPNPPYYSCWDIIPSTNHVV